MFEIAIEHVLKNEGGYINHKADPGGATKYGVSLRFMKGLGLYGDFNGDGKVNGEDVKIMSLRDAKEIYRRMWWDKYRYGEIQNLEIATKILDMSVNIGSYNAHKIVQKSLNSMGAKLTVDGVIGSKTISTLNSCSDQDTLMIRIIVSLSEYYIKLYREDEKNRIYFIKGWLKRAFRK
jgi:lysozyme family protein